MLRKNIQTAAKVFLVLAVFAFAGGKILAYNQLTNRSLTIGSSLGGVVTTHAVSFTFPAAENVGSIAFQYCTDPIDTVSCVNPPGSNVSAAVLTNQSGETGFTVFSQTTNQIILSRAAAVTGLQPNEYDFSNVTNPSNKGPFFVRITAYANSNGTGPVLSFAAVAGAITQSINIQSQVPDILYFCATVVIPTNCDDAAGDFIDFGTLTPLATHFATSQFLVGTNAANGYSVTTNGPTMSAGKHVIPALAAPSASKVGVSQFGINLRANLTPLIGADLAGGRGFVMPNYNTSDKYAYQDGGIVAESAGRSEEGIFTVSYIININDNQPPGVYDTTITYVCTAGF